MASTATILWIVLPSFIGLHVGWYMLQQKYVPENERHEHPAVKLYLKYFPKNKE